MNTTTGSALLLDAEALYGELLRGVRALLQPDTRLAGITSGGAWLVERLQRDLGLEGAPSVLSSALHRDDFAQRGLAASAQTQIAFDVNGADAHPLFGWLRSEKGGVLNDAIKWNFTKFLIDREGRPVRRYAPTVEPAAIEADIRKLL